MNTICRMSDYFLALDSFRYAFKFIWLVKLFDLSSAPKITICEILAHSGPARLFIAFSGRLDDGLQ